MFRTGNQKLWVGQRAGFGGRCIGVKEMLSTVQKNV